MLIFFGIIFVFASVMLYKSTYGVYKHNRSHEHWETRIVKTETGKFQVQCWQHESSDWYCEDPMGWYAIEYLYKKGGYLLWDYGNRKDYSIEYKKG